MFRRGALQKAFQSTIPFIFLLVSEDVAAGIQIARQQGANFGQQLQAGFQAIEFQRVGIISALIVAMITLFGGGIVTRRSRR